MSATAFWPNADDYRQAIQNLHDSVEDEELRAGQPSLNARRKATLWAGNFAVVFRIECPATGKSWALKCFTREVSARRERYRHIAAALEAARLPFTVPFVHLDRGIQVRGRWFAAVKVEWVEGQTLNRFVEESLEKPQVLQQLLDLWPKLAAAVRGLDGFLRRLGGRENRRLRWFLWAAVPLLLLAAVWAGIRAWMHWPAPSKLRPAASQIVVAGSDLKSQILIDLGGGQKMAMILIPAGEFMMGSSESDDNGESDEKPQHPVRITRPFYPGKYPVTQEQWQAVMGNNPSRSKAAKSPVQNVSWDDCQQFLKKLNAKIGRQGGKLVLPTEAQWEYACRAGSTTRYCFGDHDSGLDEYAWYAANSAKKTHPVGLKKPNPWGLYDMQGNVREWCADWYAGGYYANSPTNDPTGPAEGSYRVERNGSWDSPADRCRSAARGSNKPESCSYELGFRVCEVPADK